MLKAMHHVVYLCGDTAETVEFYTKVLGLKLAHALIGDKIHAFDKNIDYLHFFFELGDGSYVAFFDVPDLPKPEPRPAEWEPHHLALNCQGVEDLIEYKRKLEEYGCEVAGPVKHEFCESIYTHDPSGVRIEITANYDMPEIRGRYLREAPEVLQRWVQQKRSRAETAGSVD